MITIVVAFDAHDFESSFSAVAATFNNTRARTRLTGTQLLFFLSVFKGRSFDRHDYGAPRDLADDRAVFAEHLEKV